MAGLSLRLLMGQLQTTGMGREHRIRKEAAALWRELFGDPPPDGADGGDMLDLILKRMPDSGYDRLKSPHLRPTNIAMPKRPA